MEGKQIPVSQKFRAILSSQIEAYESNDIDFSFWTRSCSHIFINAARSTPISFRSGGRTWDPKRLRGAPAALNKNQAG
jgi:hypothetical protein